MSNGGASPTKCCGIETTTRGKIRVYRKLEIVLLALIITGGSSISVIGTLCLGALVGSASQLVIYGVHWQISLVACATPARLLLLIFWYCFFVYPWLVSLSIPGLVSSASSESSSGGASLSPYPCGVYELVGNHPF